MSDKAEHLTERLRNEFGNVPQWKTTLTCECLNKGDSEWSIFRKYCGMADDYNKFRSLARMIHRKCKREIGKFPEITEDMIKKWIVVNYWNDVQVKAEYQRQFDQARPEVRRAKKLLVEMRRDLGDCHTVDELRVLKWIEHGLTDGNVKSKYKDDIEKASRVSRAKALQYRLQDELGRRPVASVPELLAHFGEDLRDDDIVDYYLKRISKP